jgi:hypothetical protein
MKIWILLFLLAFLTAACGSDDSPSLISFNSKSDGGGFSFPDEDSGMDAADSESENTPSSDATIDTHSPTDASSPEDSSNPSDHDGDAETAGGPVVEILEPTSAEDPNQDTVLTETPITVRCRVTQSDEHDATKVDPSSVAISLVVGTDVVAEKSASTAGNDIFESSFAYSEVENGPLAFRCRANDTSNPPRTSSTEVKTFLDLGPNIEIVTPEANANFALAEQVRIEFRVVPQPLNDADTESEIAEVALKVAGVDIDIEEIDSDTGLYRAFVDFADATLFPNTPEGATPITISATNQRTPEAVTRISSYNIVVDGNGPQIVITDPKDGDYVTGEVVLKFTIDDLETSVDNSSVVVTVNTEAFPYDPKGMWSINNDQYVFRFDARNIPGSTSQITINITAKDIVGNSAKGASMILRLDDVPPLIDLDPPMVRERIESGDSYYCSFAFDPLGPLAVNQNAIVKNMAIFRAIVWDLTSDAPGQTYHYFSLVNPDTVYLYIQGDTNTPLLIDTDLDGICDELDTSGLRYLKMQALEPKGEPFYGGESSAGYSADEPITPTVASSFCEYKDDTTEPNYLCASKSSDMTRVIEHWVPGHIPVVYAVNIDDVACTGGDWEIGALIQEGPACVAVRAEDNAGNVGISPPLVICYDDPTTKTDYCTGVDLSTINCTDDCTPPPGLEPVFQYPLDRL